jgi:acyl-coenzyme A thioesterase PaaI-like protein
LPLTLRMNEPCLQERLAPASRCFGCGPDNPLGLRIRSFARAGEVFAERHAAPHHEAFPGMLNGGIIGTLLDCNCNWSAAWHLMQEAALPHPPCTVTADHAIRLLRPTPSGEPVELLARIVEASADRATVEGTLSAAGKPRATCLGTFVAVTAGHPAYHRW